MAKKINTIPKAVYPKGIARAEAARGRKEGDKFDAKCSERYRACYQPPAQGVSAKDHNNN